MSNIQFMYDNLVDIATLTASSAATGFPVANIQHPFRTKRWKTAGNDWSLVKDLSNESLSQSYVISLARITDSICLAGTYPDGQIWRSTDAGETWSLVKDLSNESPAQIYAYSLARVTDTICLAGTNPDGQIWRSTDAGLNWSLVKDLSDETPSQPWVLSLTRVTDTICLAGTDPDAQIWRSTDAGATWALIKDLSNESPAQNQVFALARMTDSICLAGTNPDGQIWRSTDAGATWFMSKDLSNESPSQTRIRSLARITDAICLAGTYPDGQIWRSLNAGIQWVLVKDLSDETLPQSNVLGLAGITDSICLAGTNPDGQIWRSTNAGVSWALIKDLSDETPSQTSIYGPARITDSICLVGTYPNGQIWRSAHAGEGPGCANVVFDLGSAQGITCIALADYTWAKASGIFLLEFNSSDSWDAPAATEVLTWAANPTANGNRAVMVKMFSSKSYQYVRLNVSYHENWYLGRVFLGTYFQPERGYKYDGYELRLIDPSYIEQTIGGQEHTDELDHYREVSMNFTAVSQAQLELFQRLWNAVGRRKHLFVAFNYANKPNEMTMYGKLPEGSMPTEWESADHYPISLLFREAR